MHKYRDLYYYVNYKHKKNISIKVEDRLVVVNVPINTSISYIEECLERYYDKLIKGISGYNAYYDLCDGGYIDIFNQRYTIKINDLGINKCEIKNSIIYVYSNDINKCLSVYLYKLLYAYIDERIHYYLKYHFNLNKPDFSIKKYKSRWGSCFYNENRITFNVSLIHIDKELIDYVIVHELCHFLVHNHSSLFYKEVEKRIPHYKQLISRLKEKHV